MQEPKGVGIIVSLLLLTGCVGVRLGHRSMSPSVTPADVESRYIEGYSASRPKPVAVVFVHGLFGHDATWGKGDLTLPHLLAVDPDLQQQLDLFLFEYESPLLHDAHRIPSLAEQLSGALDDNLVWANHQKVIFVAHSMGGLIVRQYLIAHPEHVQKVQMMFFYAVPTNGAKTADVARHISSNPQLSGMIPLEGNNFLDAVNSAWQDSKALRDLPTYCAFESQDTYGIRIVTESSALYLCNESPQPLNGNHLQIVKPNGPKDPRFTRLATAIESSLQSNSVNSAAQAIDTACLQNIEVCSNPDLIQRAFIMQQRLKKFADDWRQEEEYIRHWAQQMEENRQKMSGSSQPFQPLPPDSSPEQKAEWNRRLGFETWLQKSILDVIDANRKKYDDQFRTDALQIRDELVNRDPPARALSGYNEYGKVDSYQQAYSVVAHLGNCIDALPNKPELRIFHHNRPTRQVSSLP